MKENFESTVRFILKEEGGYVTDHAGATKMGLTVGLMKALKLDLNHDGAVDGKDVTLVDEELVRKVFLEQFWNPVGGDDLPPGMDLMAADFAYNAGPKAARGLLAHGDVRDYTLGRIRYYWQLRCKNPGKYRDDFDGWIGRSIRAWQKAVEMRAGS